MRGIGTNNGAAVAGRSQLRTAAADERGSVTILFGLSIVALMISMGLAVDMGLALNARTKLSQAIDVAVLSAAKAARDNNLDQAKTKDVAQLFVDSVVKDIGKDFATMNPAVINVSADVSQIDITLSAVYQTRFGGIVGIPTFLIDATGAGRIDGNDIEVGMQLDVTGSMNDPLGGQIKIAALRDAAKNAIDILMPDTPGPRKVRVGLAPFSAGVNAGTYAGSVNGGRAATCTYDRKIVANQTSDSVPAGANSLTIKADLTGSVQDCPTASVVGMSDDKSKLKTAIDGFIAGGTTAGHLGAAWSWYLLSPTWASVWGGDPPAPYKDGKTIKISVMMTDGDYNTVRGVSNATNQPISDKFAVDTCAEMKKQGILVYTIGFGTKATISPEGEATLSACATDITKFFLADDPAALNAAFAAIAQDIVALRLTK